MMTPEDAAGMPRVIRSLTLSALLPTLLVACHGPTIPEERLDEARFTAQVMGDLSLDLEGTAYSADAAGADGLRVWVVDMEDDSAHMSLSLRENPRRVEPTVYRAASGRIAMTERSPDRDRGRGVFDGSFRGPDGKRFTILGRFHTVENPDRVD